MCSTRTHIASHAKAQTVVARRSYQPQKANAEPSENRKVKNLQNEDWYPWRSWNQDLNPGLNIQFIWTLKLHQPKCQRHQLWLCTTPATAHRRVSAAAYERRFVWIHDECGLFVTPWRLSWEFGTVVSQNIETTFLFGLLCLLFNSLICRLLSLLILSIASSNGVNTSIVGSRRVSRRQQSNIRVSVWSGRILSSIKSTTWKKAGCLDCHIGFSPCLQDVPGLVSDILPSIEELSRRVVLRGDWASSFD